MYQPDALANHEVNDATYLVTANNGDAKKTWVAKLALDQTLFPNAEELRKPENLGGLETATTMGHPDADVVYAHGERAFSI